MTAPLVQTLVARPRGVQLFDASRSAIRSLGPATIVIALAALVQSLSATSSDVSWLITLCEKILDGQKPYLDFIETNPPGAIYIYWPGVAAARLFGLRPELTVPLSGFLAIVLSLRLCAAILKETSLAAEAGSRGLAFTAIVLSLLPAREFDQREHFAVILGLPFFAALIARASKAEIDLAFAILAGLCGALMMSIKPYFVLLILPTLPYLVWRVGPRTFFAAVELYVAAGCALLYVALIAICFPAYLERIAPMAAVLYVPIRAPFAALAFSLGPACWLTLGAMLVGFDRRRLSEPLIAVPALGALGGIVSFFIQGKGWPYHAYPALALMAFAAAPLILSAARPPLRGNGLVIVACSAVALSLAFAYFSPAANDQPALERLVAGLSPHPKVLTIGPDIALGHPLTRRVAGVWVGVPNGLWITAMASYLMQKNSTAQSEQERYESYLDFDRKTLIADIETKSPDAILFQNEKWRAWAFAHDDVAAALADYAPIGAVGEVTVYGRRPSLRPSQDAQ